MEKRNDQFADFINQIIYPVKIIDFYTNYQAQYQGRDYGMIKNYINQQPKNTMNYWTKVQ